MLALAGSDDASLKVIFHEYAHLLLRRNQPFWPLWLSEGMAEIYATFEVNGRDHARIGLPIDHHLRLLAKCRCGRCSAAVLRYPRFARYNERRYNGSSTRNRGCSPIT